MYHVSTLNSVAIRVVGINIIAIRVVLGVYDIKLDWTLGPSEFVLYYYILYYDISLKK